MTADKSSKASEPQYQGRELIRKSSGTQRDILSVVLQPDQYYTAQNADSLVDSFLKKEAKA